MNLLKNGSFESGDLYYWTVHGGSIGSDDIVRHGKGHAVRLKSGMYISQVFDAEIAGDAKLFTVRLTAKTCVEPVKEGEPVTAGTAILLPPGSGENFASAMARMKRAEPSATGTFFTVTTKVGGETFTDRADYGMFAEQGMQTFEYQIPRSSPSPLDYGEIKCRAVINQRLPELPGAIWLTGFEVVPVG